MKANHNRARRRASKDGKRNEMKLKTNEPENEKQGIYERDKAEPFCIPLTEMERKLERRWKEKDSFLEKPFGTPLVFCG
ncbi:hypothetical protein P8452_18682 [Trifolium repens]|nr:hypothetical protein QL285_059349 [Trifolium repens]WJX30109.1 hypothetical protein P8452_18682 [Trifolium repens]